MHMALIMEIAGGLCTYRDRNNIITKPTPTPCHHDLHTPIDLSSSSVKWGGALDGGPQCRLSILRIGNVPCAYF